MERKQRRMLLVMMLCQMLMFYKQNIEGMIVSNMAEMMRQRKVIVRCLLKTTCQIFVMSVLLV
jgi:hypothetical protein